MKPLIMIKTLLGFAPNCQKVNAFLADYMDGSLPEKTAKQFEDHIGMCKCCGPYFEQYRDTVDMAKCCEEVKLPEELVEHTLSFLRKSAKFPQ